MAPRHLSVVGEILAKGSRPPPTSDRLQAACVRACDAHASVRRKAERLLEELDEVTSPGGGVPTTELHDEDSAVITIREARQTLTPKLGS